MFPNSFKYPYDRFYERKCRFSHKVEIGYKDYYIDLRSLDK